MQTRLHLSVNKGNIHPSTGDSTCLVLPQVAKPALHVWVANECQWAVVQPGDDRAVTWPAFLHIFNFQHLSSPQQQTPCLQKVFLSYPHTEPLSRYFFRETEE